MQRDSGCERDGKIESSRVEEEKENEGRTDRKGDRKIDSPTFDQTGRQAGGHLIRQGGRKKDVVGAWVDYRDTDRSMDTL